jgi:SpoVK/Ycf46/Vps4 family AAA+-type ATPase
MRRRKDTKTALEDFCKTDLVEKELIDKITLWMLRIILKLGGAKEFLDQNNSFYKDSIAYFLDVGAFTQMDRDDFKRSEVLAILKTKLAALEKRKRFSGSKLLTKNIKQLSKLMDLNIYEEQVLEFKILLTQYEILDDTADMLGNNLNSSQVKNILSGILDIPLKNINDIFRSSSKLNRSSILTITKNYHHDLNNKLEFLSDTFADNMFNQDEDISVMIKDTVKPCQKSELTLQDYQHISSDLEILVPYLKKAVTKKKSGVNILLYGLPGTGKTELAKTLSQALNMKLFEISYADEDDEAIDGYRRLKAYKTAQALMANQNVLLMYDEAEDVFDSRESIFAPKRQENKAWLNKMLETNTIPTIWITNNIYSIDNAMIRRFDFSVEIPIPNKSKRAEIIKNYSNDLLDEASIKLLAENTDIAPALITRTAKVVSSITTEDKTKAFTQVLNNTLKAQGYKEIQVNNSSALPSVYDPKFINTTADLEHLTQGIKEHQNARLCLYGPAGTGKSAFGKYVAEQLDRPVLLKKGSDLISMWVGGTEKNIANAFYEAKEENAVLIFDEVDSFLADRSQAHTSWEVTQVNEMLVQMENFDGIFIATTNLMDNLDKASLRRFDLKLEFDYLKAEQSWNIFVSYAQELKLAKPSVSFKRAIENLKCLTPGDFAAVVRQNRFRPIRDVKDLIQRLENEIAVKNAQVGKVMGFLR